MEMKKSIKTSTCKKKISLNKEQKMQMWKLFQESIKETAPVLESVISSSEMKVGNRECCEQCNSLLAFNEEGFLSCTDRKCGILYKDLIDHRAEWRYYGADDNQNGDPTRCGMPVNPLLKESSFGCKVLTAGGGSYEMRKIRRYTEWQSMPYKEKAQYNDFQVITIMAQNAGLPKIIIDDAVYYHKKIKESEESSYRGENREGILAASIYIACKINQFPRTPKELSSIFHLDPTSATKGCKHAQEILNHLEKDMDDKNKTQMFQTKPVSFLDRYCTKLQLGTDVMRLCHFVAQKVEEGDLLSENTPHSVAAGIVFFVANLYGFSLTKKDIKRVSEISEVTINKCLKKLMAYKTQLVPSFLLQPSIELVSTDCFIKNKPEEEIQI